MQLNILLCGVLAATAAVAAAEPSQSDRQSILSMAGEYRVNFGFEEILTLSADSSKSEPYVAHGHEKVVILEDKGDFISLQHLLIVGKGEEAQVVKHWRQDWQFEPKQVLLFRGDNTWSLEEVPAEKSAGAWSQTVYQVDDSPRYAGVAPWKHIGNYSYWESDPTWRPLPRREAEARKDYDVLVGTNRHSITPEGWAHEQDNLKLALHPERAIARERGENIYKRDPEFDYSAATAYWEDTAPFWQEVRSWWNAQIAEGKTFHYAKAENSLEPHLKILELAERYAQGEFHGKKGLEKALQEGLSERLLLTQGDR